jgi:hypothetical protein
LSSYSVHYEFSQQFNLPGKAAFYWCIDYRSDDWARMGKNGKRKIKRINEDTLILTDIVVGKRGPVTKRRLVRLNPERLAWTNTHISGPNKHSQFWYQIVATGSGKSRLDFTGMQVNYGKRPSAATLAKIAKELKADDSRMWSLLAKEMSSDFRKENEKKTKPLRFYLCSQQKARAVRLSSERISLRSRSQIP